MGKCRYCQKEKDDVIYTEFGNCCSECHEIIWNDDNFGEE